MRKNLALLFVIALGCKTPTSAGKPGAGAPLKANIDQPALVAALVRTHSEAARARAERGVKQVASFWRAEDGDAPAFVKESFVSDPAQLEALLRRFSAAF